MGGSTLSLDTVLSASLFFVGKRTPTLRRNQSRDLLRFLLCKFYDQGKGKLHIVHVTLAQTTLARKVGLSRQWVGTLLARLQQDGWIEFSAPTLDDGMRGSTVFRIGPQLQRILVMLLKYKPRKSAAKLVAKDRWQFSPTLAEKKQILIRHKEHQPPSEIILSKLPLLKSWLERGKADKGNVL